jgi:Kef-type K+ transport system membrane component KefB
MTVVEYLHSAIAVLPVLAKFSLGMALIVIIPRLSRRVGLPEAVGLLLSGILVGPHVLDVFSAQHPVAQFFAELGMLLLMFLAGLEIDLTLFRQKLFGSIAFGVATTAVPLLLGTVVTLALGYPVLPAIVVGSLLASHTLLGLTIVAKLGLREREPIVVTIGATMISDILSLLVFAICVPLYARGFDLAGLVTQVAQIVVFVPLVLFGMSYAAEYLLKKVEREEETYFVLMLVILGVTAMLAERINLPGIVGAFLAGLAVNAAVKEKPAKNKLEFLGNALFIPVFFIVTGFLIDPLVLARSLVNDFYVAAGIITALLAGKWIAAEATGRAFGYSTAARRTVWSLTLPQVAATLAATLVAYRTVNAAGDPLLDGRMLNAVLVMVLVTAVLGPMLTQRFAPRMLESELDGRGPAAAAP